LRNTGNGGLKHMTSFFNNPSSKSSAMKNKRIMNMMPLVDAVTPQYILNDFSRASDPLLGSNGSQENIGVVRKT
jgi:hypothetical protein